jgi:hypothetical protein
MFDQIVSSATGLRVMLDEVQCSVNSFKVLQTLNQLRDPKRPPLSGVGWERNTCRRGDTAPVICNERSGWTVRRATWGRDDRAGEDMYVQSGIGHPGLTPVTSFTVRVLTDPTADWVYDSWRITPAGEWALLTVALNDPNSLARTFAIAMTSAGSDLQHVIRSEPMTTPVSHWTQAGGHFPPRSGTWRIERA